MPEGKKYPKAERDPAVWRYAQFWLQRSDDEKLKAKFPGNKGGVRWCDVVRAALAAPARW